MTGLEKQEIGRLPAIYRPLGAWRTLLYCVLFQLPVVGWVLIIVFGLTDKNIMRRSLARAFFVVWIVEIALATLLITTGLWGSVYHFIKDLVVRLKDFIRIT